MIITSCYRPGSPGRNLEKREMYKFIRKVRVIEIRQEVRKERNKVKGEKEIKMSGVGKDRMRKGKGGEPADVWLELQSHSIPH